MIRTILRDDHPLLRLSMFEVNFNTPVKILVADMFETMRKAKGIGLAAPQIGVPDRVIVFDTVSRSGCLINPVITSHGKHKDWQKEGCLSSPGVQSGVRRWTLLEVEGFDENWLPVKFKARGLLARVIQHEIDHLDGILMSDAEASV